MRCVTNSPSIGAAAFAAMIAGTALVPVDAEAGGFAIREQSAYSQGASFAGAATCGASIQGMFWNPAVVTCAKGRLDVEGSASVILPLTDVTTLQGSTFGPGGLLGNYGDPGDIGEAALVPSSSAAFNFNDQLYFGFSVNAPFGLATDTNAVHAGDFYGRKSEAFSLNAQPIIGYRVNDMLSVGVGAQIQYFDVSLTQGTPNLLIVPGVGGFGVPGGPSATLDGDNVGFGFTAGVLFTPMPGTEIGLGFRSAVKHTLEGEAVIPAGDILAGSRASISADLTLPEMVSLGIRHRLTDKFTLLGTVEWTNWSRFGTFQVIDQSDGSEFTTLPFEYDDGWFFSLGGEYEWNDQWTFRAGVGWEESPVSDRVRSIRLPDNDRLWLSAGASYNMNERLALNLGYSFLAVSDTQVNIVEGNPHHIDTPAPVDFHAGVDAQVHIFAAGLKYSFGGEPVYMQPQPVVSKY